MRRVQTLVAPLCCVVFACTASEIVTPGDADNDPALASVDELLEGAPLPGDVPRLHTKADGTHPPRHTNLLRLMSPVRSQGRRGTCSIFSTTALMEHLYIVEGTTTEPDFSEQYLQWAVKFEVRSFPRSSGSNAAYNLRAIHQFGVVEESVWPYEIEQWNEFADVACDGENTQPTRCYTNGHPSDEIRASKKWHLPRGRYVSPLDIKGHIVANNTAVVAGMTFFYQSWNHRKSELPTNRDYWDEGYVLYPNAKDRELSLEKRAGHSILILGWDDNLTVPIVDEHGDQVLGEDGQPIVETGFYLFKNSWGTDGFGVNHESDAGYGWISMRYVHRYASVRVAGLPTVERPVEICGDGEDNDNNGVVDCDDPACSEEPACLTEELEFRSEPQAGIPDNHPAGVVDTLVVDAGGTIANLIVEVNITHTYRGDLRVVLRKGDTSIVLHNRAGWGQDDLIATYRSDAFTGGELAGEWTLSVSDHAAWDRGVLQSWGLRVQAQ